MPLEVAAPPHESLASPLILSRVHWVRPALLAEVKYLTSTQDSRLREVIYEGLREDKPASEVRREVPHPKAAPADRRATASKLHDPRIGQLGRTLVAWRFVPIAAETSEQVQR